MASADDDPSAAFQRALARYSLESEESKISFVAAALMGAEEIARTIYVEGEDHQQLARSIYIVMHETLRLRRVVRARLRAFDPQPEKGAAIEIAAANSACSPEVQEVPARTEPSVHADGGTHADSQTAADASTGASFHADAFGDTDRDGRGHPNDDAAVVKIGAKIFFIDRSDSSAPQG